MPKKAGKNGTSASSPSTNDEGHYQIQGELLWKYRALDSEYVKIQTDLKMVGEQITAYLEKNPDFKELLGRKTELLNQTSVAMKELNEVRKEVEERLGVNLQDCAIDDKTGVLYVLKDGQQVPLSPKTAPTQKKTPKKRTTAGSARV